MSYLNLTTLQLMLELARSASESDSLNTQSSVSQQSQSHSHYQNSHQHHHHQLLQLFRKHFNQSDFANLTTGQHSPLHDVLWQSLLNQSSEHYGLDAEMSAAAAAAYPNYPALNGTTFFPVERDEAQINVWIKVMFYVLYAMICLLGISGNAIVCFVVARNSSMHTVTNVFIANLALSDIFLCIFAVPFTPLYLIAYKSWVFGTALCHLVPFAQGVSVYISAFTLMSIAIDRYFVILYPFKARMEMKRCISIIITIWISASILTLPYAHFMELIQVDNDEDGESKDASTQVLYCDEHWPYEETRKTFGISTTILQFVIPFIIITFCYVRVCAKLWDRAKTIPGSVSARREEQERERTRKTNGMLISMVVIFVVSWLPLNFHNLLVDFYIEATLWHYQRAIFLIVHAVAMASTCYNPFLYAWLNENFRKEFKEILPCCSKLKQNFLSATLVELRPRNNSLRSSKVNHNSRCVQLRSSKNGKNTCQVLVNCGPKSDKRDSQDQNFIYDEDKSCSDKQSLTRNIGAKSYGKRAKDRLNIWYRNNSYSSHATASQVTTTTQVTVTDVDLGDRNRSSSVVVMEDPIPMDD